MIVFVVGVAAAVALGLGWVLQQRVAARGNPAELLTVRLVQRVMRTPLWWGGIASMTAGSVLGGWALNLGSVSLVEPLLSANLLFAFAFAAWMNRARVTVSEVGGAVLLSAALGTFIAVGRPRTVAMPQTSPATMALAIGVVAGVAAALVVTARRCGLHVESALIATGAGLLFGLQDVATRSSLVLAKRHGVAALAAQPWPYVVVVAAAVGILLSQNAFRAARLDYSLPPIAAAEPAAAVALGVTVLGDRLASDPLSLAVETGCLLAMLAGVVLIARSESMTHHHLHFARHQHQDEHAHQHEHQQR